MRRLLPSLAFACGIPAGMAAETVADGETIVVTATRGPTDPWLTPASIDVIDEDDVAELGFPWQPVDPVAELPGIVHLRSGGLSGQSQLRIRGAPSNATQVVYGGVPFEDPAATQNNPDLNFVNPAAIAGTEVLRGPQSGLYGSRAIGGVVNFLPLAPTPEHHGRGRLQAGSFGTVDVLGQATGPLGTRAGYAAGISATSSAGISNQTDPDAGGDPLDHEEDAFERLGGYGRVEIDAAPGLRTFASVNVVRGESEYDGFMAPDDDESVSELDAFQVQAGAGWQDAEEDPRTRVSALLAYSSYDRALGGVTFGSSDFESGQLYGTVHGWRAFGEGFSVTGGVDLRRDEADVSGASGTSVDADATQTGVWLRGAYEQARQFVVEATYRHEFHSEEADADTFRIAGAVFLMDGRSRIHAAAASGFRAPSLYELYAQDDFGSGPIGNALLEPEESLGFEIGHQTWITERLALENTLFRTQYEERIGFTSGYVNAESDERVDGIETSLRILGTEVIPVEVVIAHTWQEAEDEDSSIALLLPEHVLHVRATWRPREDLWFSLDIDWVDERIDFGPTTLDAYHQLGAVAGWTIDQRWQAFVRGENLTDEHYEAFDGYASPGIAAYVGVVGRY